MSQKQEQGLDCLFCKMADGRMQVPYVDSDERFFAIDDIDPKAPTHTLVIPRGHFDDITRVDDEMLMGHLFAKAAQIAKKKGLDNGFRVVVNTGNDGGQSVGHLHIHVLGGRQMQWPPG